MLSDLSSEGSFRSKGFNTIHQAISLNETLRVCVHQLEDAMLFWPNVDVVPPGAETDPKDDATSPRKKPTPAEAARVRYLLTNTQYTLLSTDSDRRFGDTQASRISEFCRITLILYSLTILNERPPSTSVGQQIGRTFRHILTDLACEADHTADGPAPKSWLLPLPLDFFLWAIFLAASVMRSTESDTKDWLLTSFAELISPNYGDFNDYHYMRSRLSQYLWVPSIHNSRFQLLWSEAAKITRKQKLLQERIKSSAT